MISVKLIARLIAQAGTAVYGRLLVAPPDRFRRMAPGRAWLRPWA
ncbi:MAG: hypothetical protein ACK4RZ_13425 [Paracoccaceae bacterium]